MRKIRKTKDRRRMILLSTIMALCLVITVVTITHAQELYELTITTSVPPHYKVTADENNLLIETNMKVFINGTEVKY